MTNSSDEDTKQSIQRMVMVDARPFQLTLELSRTALIMIDMQRDFLEKGGFGESLGNDVSKLRRCIEPCRVVLETARRASLTVIHTREGHRRDLSDVHPQKQDRSNGSIGKPGPLGRILVRGEPGHDIIPQLAPVDGEPVVDKPGKGSFYATDLDTLLKVKNISTIIVCGVTTEVCVHTTVREANDRGYHCVVVEDACASYFDKFHHSAIRMVWAQGGLLGSVTDSSTLVNAIAPTIAAKQNQN